MTGAYQPIKPWLDFPDQIQRLSNRGLLIDNPQRAEKYLHRIGYYRLSGYFHVFRQWDDEVGVLGDDFIDGSKFEDVLSLYLFDKKLRFLALDALERIEMAVRVDIVHILGQADPMAHEQSHCLHGNFTKKKLKDGRTEHEQWLERFEELKNRAESRNLPLFAHNMKKYGCLPIWAASCLWDFGTMTWLYKGMKYSDANLIAHKYGAVNSTIFSQWLNSLNEIRNIAAHHDRLWNISISRPSAPITKDEYWKNISNKKPFFYFSVMQMMMKVLCPNSRWSDRFKDLLEKEFPQVPGNDRVGLHRFGLIKDYLLWDLWRK